MRKLLEVNTRDWRRELPAIQQHFARFGDRLPGGLKDEHRLLQERLDAT